ncbi:MAG TPA: hypothetical protein VFF06_06855 [Polyangia bacterium]|nr:hypothetical protein [Polyangia bacterium]
MRQAAWAAFASLALGCSNGSPPSPETRASTVTAARSCVLCAGAYQAQRASAIDPLSRQIVPALDAADLAQRLGRPDLQDTIEEKIVTAQARVQSATSDDQAAAIVAALIADLDRLAVR